MTAVLTALQIRPTFRARVTARHECAVNRGITFMASGPRHRYKAPNRFVTQAGVATKGGLLRPKPVLYKEEAAER